MKGERPTKRFDTVALRWRSLVLRFSISTCVVRSFDSWSLHGLHRDNEWILVFVVDGNEECGFTFRFVHGDGK